MLEYEVGTIPSRPLSLVVRDEDDNAINIISYDNFSLEMKGSSDEAVDLTGITITELPGALGILNVTWPRDRVIFNRPGKYILRLVMSKVDGTKDITRTAEIRVREFGRIK